ncbi:protein CHROMATIN REMODELING 4-like [Papaver somniferum]|uniref:protein CHROMATIN REMODELING 4-like n=1 Tax=Papaver somniferum TaxID=3469 RepID=UPI000E703B0D|nr:protein CHROMATIN REMODELING 4-like [Papaver somniferum]
MRENGSMRNKGIDKGWVKKRKRRRIPCGPVLSATNGKESVSVVRSEINSRITLPADDKLTSGNISPLSLRKRKGDDGYYYECVICDVGGNLLCCDSCPRTYHLECLNPPLKRAPPGKWQCPNCVDAHGSQKSMRCPESSRRVRRKLEISGFGVKSSESDKLGASKSFNTGKKSSSSKGKHDGLSESRSKSSHSSHEADAGDVQPCGNIDNEKKPNLSPKEASKKGESSSSTMRASSSERDFELQPIDESDEKKVPSHSEAPKDRLTSPLGGVSSKKSRKKKKKVKKLLDPNNKTPERKSDIPCSTGPSAETVNGATQRVQSGKKKDKKVVELNDGSSDRKSEIQCSTGSPPDMVISSLGGADTRTRLRKRKVEKVLELNDEPLEKKVDILHVTSSSQEMLNCTPGGTDSQKAKKRKRKVKAVWEPKDESSERKSQLPCSTGSPKDTPNSSVASATQKDTKKNQKVILVDNQKKSGAKKGNCVIKTSCDRGSKLISVSPETSKRSRKRSPVNNQISTVLSREECKTKSEDDQQNDANFPLEVSNSLHELPELGADADKTIMDEDIVPLESKQVHRILGCRMQSSKPFSASPIHGVSEIKSTGVASRLSSLSIAENHGNSPENKSIDVSATTVEASMNQSFGETVGERDIRVDEIQTNKGSVANEHVDEGDDVIGKRNENDISVVEIHTQRVSLTSVCKEGDDVRGKSDENCISVDEISTLKRSVAKCTDEGDAVGSDFQVPACDVQDKYFAGDTDVGKCPENVKLDNNNEPCEEHRRDVVMEMTPNRSEQDKMKESVAEAACHTATSTVVYEFLVKWVGQSNIHNSWVSETQLKVVGKRKLENYKAKYGNTILNICQEEWSQPQRVLALRSSTDGVTEALVKWFGLSYDECTWERLDEPTIMKASHLVKDFQQFERQTLDKDSAKEHNGSVKGERQPSEIPTLLEQPKELKGGLLFGHQLEALNWLRRCWHKSKNVILADEMGLGKTVSACAFISSLNFEFHARLPCLVLVPLSTMPNWLSEFALWAPHLNVVEYHGSAKARSIIRQYEWHASDPDNSNRKTSSFKFNVLLTTYEMILADSSHLRGVPWEVLIVDEGHRLKNSGSKLFSSLNTFSFQHRVLLTGTPLQNNIGEMYNLLNFLQPSSFPSLSTFEEKFNDLTTAEKVEELKKLVAPHMLRRLKKDVMKNIPPKTERMVPVELSSIQAEYYRAMLTKNYQILRNIGKGVAQQSMLNIVMQLRKVCNHPYLIPGTEPDAGSVEFLQDMRIKASAKLTLLHSMLKILKREGHRVLIFSQMTKLLDILDDYLNVEFGPKTYERVDGSVSVADRQAAIARFNQDKSRFVFLLSTRSCGLGINLATADTVIIYDSDFNPHADIQAMNRAHRIGQSNRLLVYRLVVRASVEERILQLAKKKLMLDQLFVNKSGSQKEVEDIIRWGTEELFSDSSGGIEKDTTDNSSGRLEVTETEQKHRRRTGGLGDVYQDKCTDGNTKISWDEDAILKLLDRSSLQFGSSEGADGDIDNDLLGSVKAVEWNDEPTEEQGGIEPVPAIPGDVSEPSPEKKEDPMVGVTEENEWDRLLRLRWEKYQNDVEAALGRGKRLRKAVSYSETFAPHPTETFGENGNGVEEVEPEREYTPAGRALKTKYSKLRTRQKERVALSKVIKESCPTSEEQFGPLPPTSPSVETVKEEASAVDLEDNNSNQSQPVDTPNNKNMSVSKHSRTSKQGFRSRLSYSLDYPPVRPRPPLSHEYFLQSMNSMSYVPTDPNLLPVLGLCAPNASQLQSAQRNKNENCNLPRLNSGKIRAGTSLPDFPFHLNSGAEASSGRKTKGKEIAEETADVLPSCLKSSIPDGGFPFSSGPPAHTLGNVSNPLDSSATDFPSLQERMALPNLGFEKREMPKFWDALKNAPKSYADLFPSLSLGPRQEDPIDLSTMPLLPNFRLGSQDGPNNNQPLREVPPPALGLGQMRSTYPSLPENHKKVLDNIMMRTGSASGSGSSNSFKKKQKMDTWSEDELDSLWIGVRRYGRGNWDTMLRDPKLKFSKYRTAEDLFDRWEKEQLKIFDDGTFVNPKSVAGRSNKSANSFPGISDGMMTRALQGSRLVGLASDNCPPPRFRSHLTDMKLGLLPPADPNHQITNDLSNSLRRNCIGDFTSPASDRPGTSSNIHLEQQFLLNSKGSSSLGSMGMNCLSNSDLRQNQEVSNKYAKLPNYMDGSLSSLRDFHNFVRNEESTRTELLNNPDRKMKFGTFDPSLIKDDLVGSSSTSTVSRLPHWLREVVSIIPARPPQPDLPPTVSAIARSVRLLYGEENPSIPPFTVPGPPPCLPKDPRKHMKKKRLRKLKPKTHDKMDFPSLRLGDSSASCSSTRLAPPTVAAISSSGFPWIEPNHPSLNLNLMNSPSPSYLNHSTKPGVFPSPEVLQPVATSSSCVAPRTAKEDFLLPSMAGSSGGFLESKLPSLNALETVGDEEAPDLKSLEKAAAKLSPLLGSGNSSLVQLPDEAKIDQNGSEDDSSKTQSNPSQNGRPEIVEEVSSKKTKPEDHAQTGESEQQSEEPCGTHLSPAKYPQTGESEQQPEEPCGSLLSPANYPQTGESEQQPEEPCGTILSPAKYPQTGEGEQQPEEPCGTIVSTAEYPQTGESERQPEEPCGTILSPAKYLQTGEGEQQPEEPCGTILSAAEYPQTGESERQPEEPCGTILSPAEYPQTGKSEQQPEEPCGTILSPAEYPQTGESERQPEEPCGTILSPAEYPQTGERGQQPDEPSGTILSPAKYPQTGETEQQPKEPCGTILSPAKYPPTGESEHQPEQPCGTILSLVK